jgi:hypothetical protein
MSNHAAINATYFSAFKTTLNSTIFSTICSANTEAFLTAFYATH